MTARPPDPPCAPQPDDTGAVDEARVLRNAAELAIGKLHAAPGDVVIVQCRDLELLHRLSPVLDMIQRLVGSDVRVCGVGPGVDFAVLSRAELDANDAARRPDPEQP